MTMLLLIVDIILIVVATTAIVIALDKKKKLENCETAVMSQTIKIHELDLKLKQAGEAFDELVEDYLKFKKDSDILNTNMNELAKGMTQLSKAYESVANDVKEIDVLLNSTADDRFFYKETKSSEGVTH